MPAEGGFLGSVRKAKCEAAEARRRDEGTLLRRWEPFAYLSTARRPPSVHGREFPSTTTYSAWLAANGDAVEVLNISAV